MLFMTCGPLVLILSDRELDRIRSENFWLPYIHKAYRGLLKTMPSIHWSGKFQGKRANKQTNKQARPQGKRLGH